MYFSLKYIDFNTFIKTKDEEMKTEAADQIKGTVPSINNQELFVNPDCFMGVILDYIFEAVGVKESIRAQFDIMSDRGKFLNIYQYPPDYCAVNLFSDRGTYFVAYCEDGDANPVIARKSKEYSNLLEALNKNTKSKVRSSRTSMTNDVHKLPSHRSIKSHKSKLGSK